MKTFYIKTVTLLFLLVVNLQVTMSARNYFEEDFPFGMGENETSMSPFSDEIALVTYKPFDDDLHMSFSTLDDPNEEKEKEIGLLTPIGSLPLMFIMGFTSIYGAYCCFRKNRDNE